MLLTMLNHYFNFSINTNIFCCDSKEICVLFLVNLLILKCYIEMQILVLRVGHQSNKLNFPNRNSTQKTREKEKKYLYFSTECTGYWSRGEVLFIFTSYYQLSHIEPKYHICLPKCKTFISVHLVYTDLTKNCHALLKIN